MIGYKQLQNSAQKAYPNATLTVLPAKVSEHRTLWGTTLRSVQHGGVCASQDGVDHFFYANGDRSDRNVANSSTMYKTAHGDAWACLTPMGERVPVLRPTHAVDDRSCPIPPVPHDLPKWTDPQTSQG